MDQVLLSYDGAPSPYHYGGHLDIVPQLLVSSDKPKEERVQSSSDPSFST